MTALYIALAVLAALVLYVLWALRDIGRVLDQRTRMPPDEFIKGPWA